MNDKEDTMQTYGTVIKTKGDSAVIQTERPASCKTCANASVCGSKAVKLMAANPLQAKPGDTVRVTVTEDGKALLLLAYLFLVPVAIFFIGCFLFFLHPIATVLCAPLLVIYFIFLTIFNKKYKAYAEVTQIIPAHEVQTVPCTCQEETK